MQAVSRRALADYAVQQLEKGVSNKELAKSLTATLISSGKKKEAELLVSDIFEILESKGLLASAKVTSAKKLSSKNRNEIKKFIQNSAKVKDVIIDEIVDESVIGGFRIETSAHSWDTTVSRKLAMIKGGI